MKADAKRTVPTTESRYNINARRQARYTISTVHIQSKTHHVVKKVGSRQGFFFFHLTRIPTIVKMVSPMF